jgi:predicted nucleic acid-binding protein
MDSAQLTYWDALILAAAQRSGARYLLSEDFQTNHRYDGVEVLNPSTIPHPTSPYRPRDLPRKTQFR